MSKEEIAAGLRNAIELGESLQKASQSFINAGYNAQEVREAASEVQQAGEMGITGSMQMPEQYQTQDEQEIPSNPAQGKSGKKLLSPKIITLVVVLFILLTALGLTIYFVF